VKVLPDAGPAACTTDPPGWAALVEPSAVRLTAATPAPVPALPGPCVVDPAGGYRGLENRLYRVEVHEGGRVGAATPPRFKWSRDNASVAASVQSITKRPGGRSVLAVDTPGRDAW